MPIEEQNPDMPCASSKLCSPAPATHRPFPHPFCPISVGFKNTSQLFSSFIFRECPRPLSPDSSSGLFSKNLALIGPLYSLPFPSVSFDVCNCSRLAWSNGQGSGETKSVNWDLRAGGNPLPSPPSQRKRRRKRRKKKESPFKTPQTHGCHLLLCIKTLWLQDNRIVELGGWKRLQISSHDPLLPCHWEPSCGSDLPTSHSVMCSPLGFHQWLIPYHRLVKELLRDGRKRGRTPKGNKAQVNSDKGRQRKI